MDANFFSYLQKIMENQKLSCYSQLILIYVMSAVKANGFKPARVDTKTLANLLQFDSRTVQRALIRLVENGTLHIENGLYSIAGYSEQ